MRNERGRGPTYGLASSQVSLERATPVKLRLSSVMMICITDKEIGGSGVRAVLRCESDNIILHEARERILPIDAETNFQNKQLIFGHVAILLPDDRGQNQSRLEHPSPKLRGRNMKPWFNHGFM